MFGFSFTWLFVRDVMPEKDNFLLFPLKDCKKRESGTPASIFLLSLPTVIPLTVLETFVHC